MKIQSKTGAGSASGHVSVIVDDDWGSFFPSRAVGGDPVTGCPFANIVAAREDTRSLDVAHLDNVLVLREHVTELLTGGPMTHGAVDVFQDLCRVTGSVA
jgi:hypothetical protein